MRKFTLLVVLISFTAFVFGQRVSTHQYDNGKLKRDFTIKDETKKVTTNKGSKSPGTVIWSDDFHSPSTWSVYHATGSTGNWSITTSAGYNYTFNPPTKSNGYAGFNSDQYYNPPTPQPVMDAFIETVSAINLSAYSAVSLRFAQAFKAYQYDETWIQFSLNGGSTWTDSIEVNSTLASNVLGPDSLAVNVSSFIAGQSNVKIRFRYYSPNTDANDGGGYGWSIDDIKLVESSLNEMEITSFIPQFDYLDNGTYSYYPASCPTRIFNAAVISNTGVNNQPNVKLTVNINDQTPYSQTTGTGHNLNSGVNNDTLKVGYDAAGITSPFLLNTTGFTSPITATGQIHQDYMINYSVTSDSITTPTALLVDSFPFHVGYIGNPYTNGPNLEYSFARSNQNPQNPGISPKSWTFGGSDGDGVYTTFSLFEENGNTNVGGVLGLPFYGMDVFIHNLSTFDQVTNFGSNITGVIYKWDNNAADWVLQISSAPIDLTSSDENKWKHIQFLTDGSAEYLPAGDYLAGIEIVYNGFECFIGYDNSTIQSSSATKWFLYGGPMPVKYSKSAFKYAAMINVNVYSNYLATKNTTENNIVKIYPNPSNGIVSIVAPENSAINVYNLLGENVASIQNSTTFNNLDLSSLPSGCYIVKVINGNNVTTKKLNLLK